MSETHIMSEFAENFLVGFRLDSKIKLCGTNVYDSNGKQKNISLYWAYQWNKYYRKHYSEEIVPDVNHIVCIPCKNHVLQHIQEVEEGKISTLHGLPIIVSGDNK